MDWPIYKAMASEVLSSIWFLLAVLAFLMVTCMLSVLAAVRRNATQVHDRVRDCMKLRIQYTQGPAGGVDIINDDETNVDMVGESDSNLSQAETERKKAKIQPISSASKDPSPSMDGIGKLGTLIGPTKSIKDGHVESAKKKFVPLPSQEKK